MGSWIAYQQLVGLTLFGLPLTPDWIVSMDGHNDASVACAHGSGPGNPMEWPKLLHLTSGGDGFAGASPWMQWLVRNTAAARLITGLRPDAQQSEVSRVYADNADPDRRFDIKLRGVTFGDLDRQLTFYLQAEQNVKELFSRANILFTTQPLLHRNPVSPWYRKAFSLSGADLAGKAKLAADLDAYMAKTSATPCGQLADAHPLGYFMPRSELALERKAEEWSTPDRRLLYANVEPLFPDRYALRLPFFIDNVHMTDAGQRRVAEYFAGLILRTDLGMAFDAVRLAEAVRAEGIDKQREVGGKTATAPPTPAGPAATGRRVDEGVTAAEVDHQLLRIEEDRSRGQHLVLWTGVPATANADNTLTVDIRFDAAADMIRLARISQR